MSQALMKRKKVLWIFAIFFFLMGCGEGQEYSMKGMQKKFDKAHEDAKNAVDIAIEEVTNCSCANK